MAQYEYSLVQMAAGSRTSIVNDRLERMVADGWEPCMMSGDATVNLLMRRPSQAAQAQQPQAAAAAAPRPATAVPQASRPVVPAPVSTS